MKTLALFIIFVSSACVLSYAQESLLGINFTLPKDDVHSRKVKDYIKDKIDTDYHHPSTATIEAFLDIKFRVLIHLMKRRVKNDPKRLYTDE